MMGGSSLPENLYQSLGAQYSIQRAKYGRNVYIRYLAVNSGFGKKAMIDPGESNSSKKMDFGGTESLLTYAESSAHPELITFPVAAGAIVVIANLPTLSATKTKIVINVLDLASIYSGEIAKWNDPRLAKLNPGVQLPNETILVVARSDNSGDTEIFTDALSKFSDEWSRKRGKFINPDFEGGDCCDSKAWGSGVIKFFANQVTGMVGIVTSIPYTIGYAALSNVATFPLSHVLLQNRQDKIIQPSEKGLQAAMDYHYLKERGNYTVYISDAKSKAAYPIASYTYMILRAKSRVTSTATDCCNIEELLGFVRWIFTGFSGSFEIGLSKLSANLIDRILSDLAKKVECNDVNVTASYLTSLDLDRGFDTNKIILITMTALLLICCIAGLCIMYHFLRRTQARWLLDRDSTNTVESIFDVIEKFGIYKKGIKDGKTEVLLLEAGQLADPKDWRRKTKLTALKMVTELSHPNLLRIFGVYYSAKCAVSVYPMVAKGTLHYMLHRSNYFFNEQCNLTITRSAISGINYLHKNKLVHGSLSSVTILVSASWTLKIACWEQLTLHYLEGLDDYDSLTFSESGKCTTLMKAYRPPNWSCEVNPYFDEYALGILAIEVFCQPEASFNRCVQKLQIGSYKIKKYALFEHCNEELNPQIKDLIFDSLALDNSPRLSAQDMLEIVSKLCPKDSSMLDAILLQMDSYVDQLHITTTQKNQMTCDLQEILQTVGPPALAEKLFLQELIEPEHFDNVTICYCEIVKFNTMCTQVTPMVAVQMLNDIFCIFNDAISQFDVTKVNATANAYMILSGLPIRNGNFHAKEIADFSLKILKFCETFKIAALGNENVDIQIGIHSGPLSAGMVGIKMPTYTVFGEIVSDVVKIEAMSQPHSILASQTVHDLLTENNEICYSFERGKDLFFKRKDKVKSYWMFENAK